MTNQAVKSTGCCEPFNPEPWQEKEIVWKDKIFVKAYGKNYVVLFAQIKE